MNLTEMPSLRERHSRKRGHGKCASSVRGKTKRQSPTSAHGRETGSRTSTNQDADQDINSSHFHSVPEMEQTSRDSTEIMVHTTDSVVANYYGRTSAEKCAGQGDLFFSEQPNIELKENFYSPRVNNEGSAAVVNSQQDGISEYKTASIQNNPEIENSMTKCHSNEDEHTVSDTNCLRGNSQKQAYNNLQDNSKSCSFVNEEPMLGKVKHHNEKYDSADMDPVDKSSQQLCKMKQHYETGFSQTASCEGCPLQSLSVTTETGGLKAGTGESEQLSLTDRNTSAEHSDAHKRDKELSSNTCADMKTKMGQQRPECIPLACGGNSHNCQVEMSLKTTECMKNSTVQGPADISNDELSLTKMAECESNTSDITGTLSQVISEIKATEKVKGHTGQELPHTSITTNDLPVNNMAHQRLSSPAFQEDSCQKISDMEIEGNHSKLAEATDNTISTGKALSQITENMCTVTNMKESAAQDGTGPVENNSAETASNKVISTDNEISASESVSAIQQTQDTGMTLSQRQRKKFKPPLKQNITSLMPASHSIQESCQNTSCSVTLATKQDEISHSQCSLSTNDSGNTVVLASAKSYNCFTDLTSGNNTETVANEAPSSSLLSSEATNLLTTSVCCPDNYPGDLHMTCSTERFTDNDQNVSHENVTSIGPKDSCAEESHCKESDRNVDAKSGACVKDMCYYRDSQTETGKLVCNTSYDKDEVVSNKPRDQIGTTHNPPRAQDAVSSLHNRGNSSKAENCSQMTCDNTEEISTNITESKSSDTDSMNKANISVSVLEPVPSEHPNISCQAVECAETSHILSSRDSEGNNTEHSDILTHTSNRNTENGQVCGDEHPRSNDVKANDTDSSAVVHHDTLTVSTTSDSDDVSESILSNNGKENLKQCHLSEPVLTGTQGFVASKNTPATPDKILAGEDDNFSCDFAGEEEQYLTLNSHEADKISTLTLTSSDIQVESVSEINTKAGVSSHSGIVASKLSCTETIETSINNSCEIVGERGNVIKSHTGIMPDRQSVAQDKDCKDPLDHSQMSDCMQPYKRTPESEIGMSNVCTSKSSAFPVRHAEIIDSLFKTQQDHKKDDNCPVLAVSHSSTAQSSDHRTDRPQHIQTDFFPSQITKAVDKTLSHPTVVVSVPSPAVMTCMSTNSAISRSPVATLNDSSMVASTADSINHNHSATESSTVLSECSSATSEETDHISHSLTAKATVPVSSASPSVHRLVQWTAAQSATVLSESCHVPTISDSRDTSLTNYSETIQPSLHMSSIFHPMDRSSAQATTDNRNHSSTTSFPTNTANMSSNRNSDSNFTSNGVTSIITSNEHQTDKNVKQPSHATSMKSPVADTRGKTDTSITLALSSHVPSTMREHIVQVDMSPGLMCHAQGQIPVSQDQRHDKLSCNDIVNSAHKQNVDSNGQPKFQSMFSSNSVEISSNLTNCVTTVSSDNKEDVAHINLVSNKPQFAERKNNGSVSETRSANHVPQKSPDYNTAKKITSLTPLLSPQTIPISTTETSEWSIFTTPTYSSKQVNDHNKTVTSSKTTESQWKIPENFQDLARTITRQTSINSDTDMRTMEAPEPSVSLQVPATRTCSNKQVNYHNKIAAAFRSSESQWKIPEDFQNRTRTVTRQTLISSDRGMSTMEAPKPPISLQIRATPRCSYKHMNDHGVTETATTVKLYESQRKMPEDFQETAKTLPKQTSVDQDTDISDSQLFLLSTEDFEQDFETCSRKPVTKEDDPMETVHNVEVQDQCDLAQRKALEEINQKRVEGEKLLTSVMADLVSINRQLLKMKREMEMMKRRMGQQQQQQPLQQQQQLQHHLTRFAPGRGGKGGGSIR